MTTYPAIAITFPYTETPPAYRTIRTEMESGYVQTRAKVTIAPRMYEFAHEHCSAADRVTFLAFWIASLGGASTFNFTEPNSATVVVCRFMDAAPPKIQRTSPSTYTIGPIRVEEAL